MPMTDAFKTLPQRCVGLMDSVSVANF